MPTYEFRCPDGTIIERVFKMSEVPDAIPVPNGTGMAVRIISGGADLIFKGSGFYITDYGKDGKKDQRAEKDASAKRDESKSADASDTAKKPSDAPVAATSKSPEKGDAAPAKSEPKSKPPTPPSGAAA
jgi:predicted nucleic acid-binding Zn ribbon protein